MQLAHIVVDVESDGQSPANASMVCFGAVAVFNTQLTFFGKTRPITKNFDPQALAISNYSRVEHEGFEGPELVMKSFELWVKEVCGNARPVFVSDNPAFDWQWINFYFHKYLGSNPFGFSARRIGDLYCGMVKDASKNWEWKKNLRETTHDHNPVNDALGNAEALIAMKNMGLKIDLG